MEEKFIESIEKARKSLQIADHLVYMTYPLIKEKKLLLKALEEIGNALIYAVNAVLQYEYIYKRIQIYKDARDNFETFKRMSPRYKIDEKQVEKILEILALNENHKKSPFEFVKSDKIVIMLNGFKTETLTLERIKGFLIETKDILRKINLVLQTRDF